MHEYILWAQMLFEGQHFWLVGGSLRMSVAVIWTRWIYSYSSKNTMTNIHAMQPWHLTCSGDSHTHSLVFRCCNAIGFMNIIDIGAPWYEVKADKNIELEAKKNTVLAISYGSSEILKEVWSDHKELRRRFVMITQDWSLPFHTRHAENLTC